MEMILMEKEIYKYKINELNILIGKKVIPLAPENILELEFNYDFDKYFFPIIRLSLNTSLNTIYSLRENPDISKVHLEMSYYIYESEESDFDYEEEFINLTKKYFFLMKIHSLEYWTNSWNNRFYRLICFSS